MEIQVSEDCKINPISNTYLGHEMRFIYPSKALIASFTQTNIMTGYTITDNYKAVLFHSPSIQKFNQKQKITFDVIIKMIYCLSLQLDFLIKNYNKCFIGYSSKNILVIDGNKFIYIPNEEDIYDINRMNDKITITFPFNHTDFYQSPETLSIKTIPSDIHYKSVYFSLGCLIIDYFNRYDNQSNNQNNNQSNNQSNKKYEELLDTLLIKNSKLYYFLKRCLNKEPEKRTVLYI